MSKKDSLKQLLKKNGIVLIFAVLVIAASLKYPMFLTYKNITNILTQNSMIGIISLGMTLVILTGGIDLSVGSLCALSSIIAAYLSFTHNIFLMVLVPIAACTAAGLLNGIIVTKLQVAPFIATLAVMMGARGIALVPTNGISVTLDSEIKNIFGRLARGTFLMVPIPVWIFAVLAVIGIYFTNKVRMGRYIYATGGNEEAARMMGLRPERIKLLAYTISGCLAGLAGIILAARLGSGQPVTCEGWEMNAIAAAAIGGTLLSGGRGGLSGTVVGTLILGVITNIINLQGNLNSWWQEIVTGILLLIVVMSQVKQSKSQMERS